MVVVHFLPFGDAFFGFILRREFERVIDVLLEWFFKGQPGEAVHAGTPYREHEFFRIRLRLAFEYHSIFKDEVEGVVLVMVLVPVRTQGGKGKGSELRAVLLLLVGLLGKGGVLFEWRVEPSRKVAFGIVSRVGSHGKDLGLPIECQGIPVLRDVPEALLVVEVCREVENEIQAEPKANPVDE